MEGELNKPAELPAWAVELAKAIRNLPGFTAEMTVGEVDDYAARLIAGNAAQPAADLDRLAEQLIARVEHASIGTWVCGRSASYSEDSVRAAELARVRTLLASSIRHEPQVDVGELREAAEALSRNAQGRSGGSVYLIHREKLIALRAALAKLTT